MNGISKEEANKRLNRTMQNIDNKEPDSFLIKINHDKLDMANNVGSSENGFGYFIVRNHNETTFCASVDGKMISTDYDNSSIDSAICGIYLTKSGNYKITLILSGKHFFEIDTDKMVIGDVMVLFLETPKQSYLYIFTMDFFGEKGAKVNFCIGSRVESRGFIRRAGMAFLSLLHPKGLQEVIEKVMTEE